MSTWKTESRNVWVVASLDDDGEPEWLCDFTVSQTRSRAIQKWNEYWTAAAHRWQYKRMRRRGEFLAIKVHLGIGWIDPDQQPDGCVAEDGTT